MQEDSIVLAVLADIPDGGAYEWRADEQGMVSVLIARLGEQVFAYRNSCPHQGRPLGLGRSGPGGGQKFFFDKQQRLVCPHHGATFEIETGRSPSGPCQGGGLTPVAVRLVEGKVYLAENLETPKY
ncbi:MAG: Rieske 2Fe-2S domain-containing protein [Xanthomonadales bacterium]|nr:Rieske 2Fe-2S domain-containing protein [Xanthomonadales bacterium]